MLIGNHRITIEDVIRHLASTGISDHEVQEGSYYAISWLTATASVAPAQADIFAKSGDKIGKIVRLFGEVDLAEGRGVICQT
jgi:hypothetical protein